MTGESARPSPDIWFNWNTVAVAPAPHPTAHSGTFFDEIAVPWPPVLCARFQSGNSPPLRRRWGITRPGFRERFPYSSIRQQTRPHGLRRGHVHLGRIT